MFGDAVGELVDNRRHGGVQVLLTLGAAGGSSEVQRLEVAGGRKRDAVELRPIFRLCVQADQVGGRDCVPGDGLGLAEGSSAALVGGTGSAGAPGASELSSRAGGSSRRLEDWRVALPAGAEALTDRPFGRR